VITITKIMDMRRVKNKRHHDEVTMIDFPMNPSFDEVAKVQLLARGYSWVPMYYCCCGWDARFSTAGGGGIVEGDDGNNDNNYDVSGIIDVLLVRQQFVIDSSESRPPLSMELRQPSCISPPDASCGK
jgi:hypothetical protein